MNKEITFPFEWEDWDEVNTNTRIYYNVNFLENFGVILKGNYSSIFINYDEGFIEYIKNTMGKLQDPDSQNKFIEELKMNDEFKKCLEYFYQKRFDYCL